MIIFKRMQIKRGEKQQKEISKVFINAHFLSSILTKFCGRFCSLGAQYFCHTPKCVNSEKVTFVSRLFRYSPITWHRTDFLALHILLKIKTEKTTMAVRQRSLRSAFHKVYPNKGRVFSHYFSKAAWVISLSTVSMSMDLFATLTSSFHLKLLFYIILSAFYHVLKDYISPIIDFTLEKN